MGGMAARRPFPPDRADGQRQGPRLADRTLLVLSPRSGVPAHLEGRRCGPLVDGRRSATRLLPAAVVPHALARLRALARVSGPDAPAQPRLARNGGAARGLSLPAGRG